MYAGLAHAVLSFLRASLTLEHNDLQEALTSVNYSFKISGELRHKTSMVMKFLYRPQYNSYTDLEIHAELVHAESLLVLTLISFLADQSILCLVRGAFRIRACYQRYKECLYILEARTQWQSEEARQHFESGVRMGHGIFNLLMSYLPSRVLRILQYVGFSGNRTLGVEELEKSVDLNDGLRSVFSTLVILCYHTYVENLFGLGAYDIEKVKQFNESLKAHFPNSAFYLLFLGRQQQMLGESKEAIETYHRCIEAQSDWKQFHSICHWEIMWCYAVQMKWTQAAQYSDLQRKSSKWSPASYTYQYGTFLYAQLVEDERNGLIESKNSPEYQRRMDEIVEIMKLVPTMRIRYAGKTIPAEKFAITRSEQFLQRGNKLTLPAVEFLYVWNIFVTLTQSPEQVAKLLVRIDSEIEYIEREESNSSDCDQDHQEFKDDQLALTYLLKGMCLKQLKRVDEAEASFLKVIEDLESGARLDTFIVPHTVMELSVLQLEQKRYNEAKRWVKVARTQYTGYLLETILHFRLHAASRAIRLELDELEARDFEDDYNDCSEPDGKIKEQEGDFVLPEMTQLMSPANGQKIIDAHDNKETC